MFSLSRARQIFFSLCVMASLAFGSSSACLCSHHETKKEEAKASCHAGHEESAQPRAENHNGGSSFSGDCTCSLAKRSVVIVSTTDDKNQKSGKTAGDSIEGRTREYFAGSKDSSEPPDFAEFLTYYRILDRGKPARAPPRL